MRCCPRCSSRGLRILSIVLLLRRGDPLRVDSTWILPRCTGAPVPVVSRNPGLLSYCCEGYHLCWRPLGPLSGPCSSDKPSCKSLCGDRHRVLISAHSRLDSSRERSIRGTFHPCVAAEKLICDRCVQLTNCSNLQHHLQPTTPTTCCAMPQGSAASRSGRAPVTVDRTKPSSRVTVVVTVSQLAPSGRKRSDVRKK